MATNYFLNQYFTTTLNVGGGIDASQTTGIIIQSVTGIDITKPGIACITYADPINTSTAEWVTYTSIDGSNELQGVTRGTEGFGAKTHSNGATIAFPLSESHVNTLATALSIGGVATNGVTTTLDEDDMATNSATALATQQSIKAYVDTYGQNTSLYRQAIINGNFDVWQRGTSIALTAADGYTADRWYVETATAGTDKTVSREDGTGVNGSYYCARVKMVSDVDELLTFSQALESQDSIKFRGKKVTLSFYAKGGAEFVADNATLVSKIVTGKGTDQKVLAFTTSADAISQNNTLTTSWVKFTCTTSAVIASDITQIGVSFSFTHAGSGTTTNYFEVTQVQLCMGDVALPFQPKSYEDEETACERYCQAFVADQTNGTIGAIGSAFNTAGAQLFLPLRRRMRTVPTLTATASDWKIGDTSSSTDVTAMVLASAVNSSSSVVLEVSASSVTQFRPYFLIGDGTANRTLILSAEL